MNDPLAYIYSILYSLPAVLTAIILHECAHGWTASLLGDDTAKRSGRLTLNPLKHIDLLGLLCMITLRFGWAKPVPVNPRNFKNPRRGMILTALAGPVTNLLLAVIFMFVYYAVALNAELDGFTQIVLTELYICIIINIGLAVFNMLPLPPLDGSRLVTPFLPPKMQVFMYRNQRYIQLALAVLLISGALTKPLAAAREWVFNGIEAAVRWIIL